MLFRSAEYNNIHDNDFHSSFPSLNDKLEYLKRLARMGDDHKFPIWNFQDADLFNQLP